MMGNRLDRRLPNLICTKALEAAELIRPRRAHFHQGRGCLSRLSHKAEYMAATDYTQTHKTPFRPGLGPYMVQKIGQVILRTA